MPPTYENYPDACPPVDGIYISDECYRLIPRDRYCKSKDFRSTYEKNGHQYEKGQDKCNQRAISVYLEKSDAVNMVLQRPKMTQRCIATLKLYAEDGVLVHSPDPANGKSHHDWWVSTKFDCKRSCVKIEPVMNGGSL